MSIFTNWFVSRDHLIQRIAVLSSRAQAQEAKLTEYANASTTRERELAEARNALQAMHELREENLRMTVKILELQEDNRKLEEQGMDFAQEATDGRLRIEELERELDLVTRQRDEECAHRQQLQRELNSRVVEELVSAPAPAPTKRGGRRTKKSEVITDEM